jgi:hypothetical protein
MAARDPTKVNANEDDQKHNREEEHPSRAGEPDTTEGPGGRHESKGEVDARNKTTRRGER